MLLLAAAWTVAASAQTPPEQVEAYVMVIKAEQAEQAGDPGQALLHYREALSLYRRVGSNYPDWRPELIRYRVADCLNQIKRLEKETVPAETEEPPASEPSVTPPSEDARESEGLRIRIAELEQQLADQERIGRESASGAVRIADLEAALSDAEEERRLLQGRIDALTTEAEQGRRDQAALASTAPDDAALRAERDRLAEEVKALKETVDLNFAEMNRVREYKDEIKALKKINRQLDREVEKLRAGLEAADQTEEVGRLRTEKTVLAQEIDMFRQRLEASEKRVRELEREARRGTEP